MAQDPYLWTEEPSLFQKLVVYMWQPRPVAQSVAEQPVILQQK
jgi:hypothetical protein